MAGRGLICHAKSAANSRRSWEAWGHRPKLEQVWEISENRRLSLPRFEPWTCHQEPQLRHGMGAALMRERERSVTPLAMPVRWVRPISWQVSGPADGVPRAHVADLRRMRGEVHQAAAALL